MDLVFRKSSKSTDHGECVEVAVDDAGRAHLRDSKDPHGPVLAGFAPGDWAAFTAAVKSGRLG
ncbi:hypothetical protein Lfu02_64150 [Longispora fulva]|uniref:DUF397 domain-containing protein n=1 Tax=Longispora fulva TaxID=619741 RepID=A0A8J7GFD1_9ACTN|nr:DUF397 domain-containing protein [Longispora fulva]MBG6137799.1 hypothetical protein [Longispora fulva]GIG62043.1 hypothetical protein Lfu02_64150 [Longispora fulva]